MPKKKESLLSLKNIGTGLFIIAILVAPTQTQKVITWGTEIYVEYKTKKVQKPLGRLQESWESRYLEYGEKEPSEIDSN